MSAFDAITAPENLFRSTSTGLRVFAPMFLVGRLAVVSDADALRIQRDVRRWAPVVLVACRANCVRGSGARAVGIGSRGHRLRGNRTRVPPLAGQGTSDPVASRGHIDSDQGSRIVLTYPAED